MCTPSENRRINQPLRGPFIETGSPAEVPEVTSFLAILALVMSHFLLL